MQRMASVAQNACGTRELRRTAAVSNIGSPFGQNEWLVEEMYRKFRDDPSSVDPSWHELLVDYNPEPTAESVREPRPAPSSPPAAAPPQNTPPPAAPTPPAPKATGTAAGNGAAQPAAPAKAPSPPPAEGDQLQVLRGAAGAAAKKRAKSLRGSPGTRD